MDLVIPPPLPSSFEQITVSNTVGGVGFTATKYTNKGTSGESLKRSRSAQLARVSVETNAIRYTVDGTVPTAAVGHPAAAGTTIEIEGWDAIKAFRAIRSGGADATLSVTYYGN